MSQNLSQVNEIESNNQLYQKGFKNGYDSGFQAGLKVGLDKLANQTVVHVQSFPEWFNEYVNLRKKAKFVEQ